MRKIVITIVSYITTVSYKEGIHGLFLLRVANLVNATHAERLSSGYTRARTSMQTQSRPYRELLPYLFNLCRAAYAAGQAVATQT